MVLYCDTIQYTRESRKADSSGSGAQDGEAAGAAGGDRSAGACRRAGRLDRVSLAGGGPPRARDWARAVTGASVFNPVHHASDLCVIFAQGPCQASLYRSDSSRRNLSSVPGGAVGRVTNWQPELDR